MNRFRTIFCRAIHSSALPVPNYLKISLHEFGIKKLTPIQTECFAPIMAGKSIIAVAKTGTGKTLAYLVPVVARIENERFGPFSCLVIVPTAELCQQIGSVLVRLNPTLHVCLAYGKPTSALDVLLRQGPHVIVGTTDRISRLVKRGDLDLGKLKILVIDEVDSMLLDEYRRSLSFVKTLTCQTIAVGATLNPELRKILKQFSLDDPGKVTLIDQVAGSSKKQGRIIRHQLVKVPNSLGLRAEVVSVLLGTRKFRKCVVFVKNFDESKILTNHSNISLSNSKVVHGELQQTVRDRVMNEFRLAPDGVLISTDIAARGIDVADVDLVISFTAPMDAVAYVHRAGRTGRAGNAGESVLLYSKEEDHANIEEIEKTGNFKFEKIETPSKTQQKEIALQSLIAECQAQPVGDKLIKFTENLISASPLKAATLTAKCLETLLGMEVLRTPTKSVLTGKVGFGAVHFLTDSRSELDSIITNLKVSVGAIVPSESVGFVVDVPMKYVQRVCTDCGELAKLVDSLPKLVVHVPTRGRKSALPWRRQKLHN